MDEKQRTRYRQEQLILHNAFRAKHNAPPLILDDAITRDAQTWADHLAATGRLAHSNKQQYGENVAGATGQTVNATQMWYDEVKNVNDYRNLDDAKTLNFLHFSQVVWKGSRRLGIGIAVGNNGWTYVIANYDPPGNMRGNFGSNVEAPKNETKK